MDSAYVDYELMMFRRALRKGTFLGGNRSGKTDTHIDIIRRFNAPMVEQFIGRWMANELLHYLCPWRRDGER